MEEPVEKSLTAILAPYLVATILIAVFIMVVLVRVVGTGPVTARVEVVSFDIVKFSNAQRAVASAFMSKSADVAQANDLLLGLSKRTRIAIEEAAGPGTLVLVKQSVIQGVSRDITEEVLKRLSLPLDTPTQDSAEYVLDVAPTMLMRSIEFEKSRAPFDDKPRFNTGEGVLP